MSRRAASSRRRALSLLIKVALASAAAALTIGYLKTSGLDTHIEVVLGVFAAFLAVNVIIVAMRSENSHRNEDEKIIDDVHFIAGQCKRIFELMRKTKNTQGDDMRRALDQLAIRIRLFVTQYRRYLTPAMVESLRYVEREVLKAQITGGQTSKLIVSIGKAVKELQGGIRDVDDPELVALRRKI